MGVYIRGMEMPKDCRSCRFCFGYICLALKCGDGDCPLVPVPPHGRLIDADEAVRFLCTTLDPIASAKACGTLAGMKAIIPAYKDGE